MSSAVRGADHAWAFRPLLGRAPVVRLLPVRLLLLLLGPATVLPHLLAGPALVLLLPPRMGPAMVPTRLLVLNHLRRAAVTPGFLAGRRPHQGDDDDRAQRGRRGHDPRAVQGREGGSQGGCPANATRVAEAGLRDLVSNGGAAATVRRWQLRARTYRCHAEETYGAKLAANDAA